MSLLPLAALGGLLTLGACTMGPNWQRPDSPGRFSYQAPAGQPAPSQASEKPLPVNWWDIFGDPELSSLERRAVSANLDVQEATARFAQSRAAARITGADRYPSIGGNASYTRERASPNGILSLLGTTQQQSASTVANGTGFGPSGLPGSGGSPPFDLWQYGVDASWELDLWGRVRREMEAANAETEASADMRRGILVSVLVETARDYLLLRGVQAQIAITRQNLDIAEHSLALTRLRLQNGATTDLDVANAGAAVSTIKASLPGLISRQAELVNALSFLLAEPPRALETELGTPRPIPPAPPVVPVGLPSELAEQRPDIRAAEAQLHAATAEIGVAKADFYPKITLGGSLDIQALQFTGLGSWGSRQYGFGPAISLPIFEGGRLRGTLELRKAQQRQAAIAYQRTVLQAWREVDDALTAYNAVQNQRSQLEDAVKQNETALKTAREQYAQGATDFLNVLTVQGRLLDSQQSLVQATTATSMAVTSLYAALGGGWQQVFPVSSGMQTASAIAEAAGQR
ncbi:efflux transporter outer membrane subunit [Acetobacteraceae bacterium KSS8]|uniref:Efflux transporter outer membrane subunit n=1 Tax=Endosaccharibacter trunci TaxID=2812733 RepID=A0ABT1WAB1_9PROT|nr:efflux transporter outer membrane subunit [Acetobacteraceae bacterium KSS8]